MSQLDMALAKLEPDERARVLTWAVAKFGEGNIKLPEDGGNGSSVGHRREAERDADAEKAEVASFSRISDLVDAANPGTGLDYVLLGSYWFQVIEGNESFTGQQVNSMLKNLGHGAANITTAYDSLKSRTPPLARQTRKKGTTKQGRKQYRLTTEGIHTVERMLNSKSEE